LRVTVGHADHARFLQSEHIAQLVLPRERVHQRQFGGAGIAEQDLDPFLLQKLKESTSSTHCGQGRFPPARPSITRGRALGIQSLSFRPGKIIVHDLAERQWVLRVPDRIAAGAGE